MALYNSLLVVVDIFECVTPVSVHAPVTVRSSTIREEKRNLVCRLGPQSNKILNKWQNISAFKISLQESISNSGLTKTYQDRSNASQGFVSEYESWILKLRTLPMVKKIYCSDGQCVLCIMDVVVVVIVVIVVIIVIVFDVSYRRRRGRRRR